MLVVVSACAGCSSYREGVEINCAVGYTLNTNGTRCLPFPAGSGNLAGRLQAIGGPSPGLRRPLNGSVYITGVVTRTIPVGADGRFAVDLPPGSYTVRGRSPLYDSGSADCTAQPPIIVRLRAVTTIDVACLER